MASAVQVQTQQILTLRLNKKPDALSDRVNTLFLNIQSSPLFSEKEKARAQKCQKATGTLGISSALALLCEHVLSQKREIAISEFAQEATNILQTLPKEEVQPEIDAIKKMTELEKKAHKDAKTDAKKAQELQEQQLRIQAKISQANAIAQNYEQNQQSQRSALYEHFARLETTLRARQDWVKQRDAQATSSGTSMAQINQEKNKIAELATPILGGIQ